MAIEQVTEPGAAILRSKMNEVIATLNSLQLLISGGAVNLFSWATLNPGSPPTVNGQGGNIESITDAGAGIRVNFATPYASADDYAGICISTAIPGKTTGISQIRAKTSDYIEFGWVVDDGGTGYPTIADVIIISNAQP